MGVILKIQHAWYWEYLIPNFRQYINVTLSYLNCLSTNGIFKVRILGESSVKDSSVLDKTEHEAPKRNFIHLLRHCVEHFSSIFAPLVGLVFQWQL